MLEKSFQQATPGRAPPEFLKVIHTQRGSADRRRQRWIEKQGYRVVRVSAATVLQETAVAVASIVRALSAPRGA
jgi:very-short-patch-repair endonuclease